MHPKFLVGDVVVGAPLRSEGEASSQEAQVRGETPGTSVYSSEQGVREGDSLEGGERRSEGSSNMEVARVKARLEEEWNTIIDYGKGGIPITMVCMPRSTWDGSSLVSLRPASSYDSW